MSKTKATLLLLFGTFIWGSSFVAQDIASNYLGSFMFNGIRSFIGFVFLFFLAMSKNNWNYKILFEKRILIVSILCGLMLFVSINLQQLGIASYPDEVAGSSRTAFITSLYVIIVTIYGTIKNKRINIVMILSALLTMVGLYFICIYGNESSLYIGDLLVVGCAIGFAVHIIYINKNSDLDGLIVSLEQLFISGLLSLICGLLFEDYSLTSISNCIGPLLYVGILSSGLAYTFEVFALQILNPTVASVIMSTESVIALVTSAIILSERLKTYEFIGCFIVLAALFLVQVPELINVSKARK